MNLSCDTTLTFPGRQHWKSQRDKLSRKLDRPPK